MSFRKQAAPFSEQTIATKRLRAVGFLGVMGGMVLTWAAEVPAQPPFTTRGNGMYRAPVVTGQRTEPSQPLYLTRAGVRRSCTSPECGRDAQNTHVLAKRGYIQMSHFGPREVYLPNSMGLHQTRPPRIRSPK